MDPQNINPGHWTRDFLSQYDLPSSLVAFTTIAVDLLVLLIASWLMDFIIRKIVLTALSRLVKRSNIIWDDHFLKEKVFQAAIHLIPLLAVRAFIPLVFAETESWIAPLENLLSALIIYQAVITVNRAAKATVHVLENHEKYVNKPVKSLQTLVQVISWFVGLLAIISVFTGTSLGTLMGAMAGTTAILMLIFQDAITGLLANFQITMFDLVRKGDWITFNKYGVDGDVISVDLTTVKVRNFNKTISTVPSKAFVSDSFINWRGMESSEVRRIKRHLVLDLDSVSFCSDALIEDLKGIERVRDYIGTRLDEIQAENKAKGVDKSRNLNGRHLTNIGIYRMYIEAYLKEHPMVSGEHSLMVRQLQAGATGVPLEIYCFSKEIRWVQYEAIVSSLFDHLMAAAPAFGLRLYQSPSSFVAAGLFNPQT